MRRFFQRAFRSLGFFKSRWFAICLLCLAVDALMLWIPSRFSLVYVETPAGSQIVRTTERDPYIILEEAGVELDSDDRMLFSGFTSAGPAFGGSAEISVVKTFPVEIRVDSMTYHLSLTGGTVSDALYRAGITLRSTDIISMTPQTVLSPGDLIEITRVDYVTQVVEESIPRSSEQIGTSLIADGRQRLLSYGSDGVRLLTYEQRFVDGVPGEMELVSEDIARLPVPDTYLVGTGEAISPLDFGYELENGRPTQYLYVLENKKATGYSARYGAGTASGLHRAAVGYVAVNPEIIPYGAKLYITAHSETGYFVYGYAIAADTGTGLMANIVDIDLFYDTYAESVLNGLRYVDIYVLELP